MNKDSEYSEAQSEAVDRPAQAANRTEGPSPAPDRPGAGRGKSKPRGRSHAQTHEPTSDGRWKVDDFFWLLRPFAPVLRPADRLQRATNAFRYLSEVTGPDGLSRAVNPLPALAAELADFFATTAPAAELGWVPAVGAKMTDYLTEAEVSLLEAWAKPGPTPHSPELPPGREFEKLPAEVQAEVRANADAIGAAAAAAVGLPAKRDDELPPPPPETPADAPKKKRPPVVLPEILGAGHKVRAIFNLTSAPAVAGFTAALSGRRSHHVHGLCGLFAPDTIPVGEKDRERLRQARGETSRSRKSTGPAYRDGSLETRAVNDLDTATGPHRDAPDEVYRYAPRRASEESIQDILDSIRRETARVFERLFRLPCGHPAVTDLWAVRVPEVPAGVRADADLVSFFVTETDSKQPEKSLIGETVTAPSNAVPVVVTGVVPNGAARLSAERWHRPEEGAARTAASLVARVAAGLVPFHTLGLPHGAVWFENVLVNDAKGEATLGPPRTDVYQFTWAGGLLDQVRTADGHVVCEYEYGVADELIRVFHYNPAGEPTAELDPDGKCLVFHRYDRRGRFVGSAETSRPWQTATGTRDPRGGPESVWSAGADTDALPRGLFLADLRDLGRLLYRLLTETPAPGRAGEPMAAADWELAKFPGDTPAELVRIGRRLAVAGPADTFPTPLAAAAALRDVVKAAGGPTDGLIPEWSHDAPTGTVGENMFDRYFLLEELGRGAFGVVYRARDELLGPEVALKIFKPDGAGGVARVVWEREARSLYHLQHPSIPRFEGVGVYRLRPYVAVEHVVGRTLGAEADRLREESAGQLDLEWVARVMQYVTAAVGYAHGQGVVHRDLKPANVLVTADEVVEPFHLKVIDFGLARVVSGPVADTALARAGTPAYMAPEQFRGDNDKIGPHTDVWAIGVMLYELLTGERPFQAESTDELRRKVLDPAELPRLPRLIRPELDRLDRGGRGQHATLSRIALDCLQRDLSRRPATADKVFRQIDRWRKSVKDRRHDPKP